jgi:electron transport complex protein RnfG
MADKKLPSTFGNMVIVLSLISLVSALALAFTYSMTKDAIARVETNKKLKALEVVLPEFNNAPLQEKYTVEGFEGVILYPAKMDGQRVGTAVETYSNNGFGGPIRLIVGFDPSNKITDISVMKHSETPGLGTKMTTPRFKDQFKGKDPAVFKMKVEKDSGEVDAVTAATISSRAFCDAAERAYRALLKGGKQ